MLECALPLESGAWTLSGPIWTNLDSLQQFTTVYNFTYVRSSGQQRAAHTVQSGWRCELQPLVFQRGWLARRGALRAGGLGPSPASRSNYPAMLLSEVERERLACWRSDTWKRSIKPDALGLPALRDAARQIGVDSTVRLHRTFRRVAHARATAWAASGAL